MHRQRWHHHIAGWFVCLMLVGCKTTGTSSSKPGMAVARVNKAVLTTDDVMAELHMDGLPTATPEQKQEWVRKWVENELLCQEAIRRGVHKDRKVKRELQKMEHDYLANLLVERELAGDRPTITEADITRYYTVHKTEFIRQEPELKFSVILLQTEDQARDVWARLNRRRADFGEMAQARSIDEASAKKQGDLGYLTRRDISDSKLRDAAFALKKGRISKPVKTESGYYIVKVTDTRDSGSVKDLSEVREEIVNSLLEEGRRNKIRQLLDRLKQAAAVEVNEKALTSNGK